MKDWPTVELAGKQFVIPRVCPNCMAPGDQPRPTVHVKAGVGRTTRYTMTFYYCAACDDMLKTKAALERKQMSFGPQLLVLWFFVFFGCLMGMAAGIGTESWVGTAIGWVMALASIAGGVFYTRRMGARRRAVMDDGLPPLPPNALFYGQAAYLIESGGGLFSQNTATFSAGRQEWLNLLVEMNPAT